MARPRRSPPEPSPAEGRLPSFSDGRGPLGIELTRAVAGAGRRVVAREGPTFVLPLYATVLEVQAGRGEAPFLLDVSRWLLVPRGESVHWRSESPLATTLLLTPSQPLLAEVSRTYAGEVEPAALARTLATPYTAPRTTWVNELAQRYAFERAVCRKRGNAATAFLEVELVKEWFFVRQDDERRRKARPSHLHQPASALERAQAYVESHLGEPLPVKALAQAAHVSPRALLRAFQETLGMPPAAYVRARRLDEALLLLRSGRYDVSEVASRVGYQNLSAFSQAFRTRFGRAPSQVRGDEDAAARRR